MKKEKDLHAELAKRRYHKPNWFLYLIYYVVGRTKLLGAKYHPHFEYIDKISKYKGPAFLIWNHQSRRDHTFLATAAWPRRINIVCEYNEFFRNHLAWALRHNQILPKKVYCNDIPGIRAMRDVIKKGGIIALSPEGNSSMFGDNQPIVPGTGRFLQAFNVPVFMAYMKGAYLTNTKHDENDRIGQCFITTKLLFTPEQLKKMTPQEIDDKINLEFHHDDYKWNKEHHIKYKAPNGEIAKGLSDILYRCPKCGAEFKMVSKKNYIKCTECNNGANIDDEYNFNKFDGTCRIPDTPSDWVHEERQVIIDEIRKDKNYSYSVNCDLGYLPKDHLVADKKVSEICGKGVFTVDHKGVHFKGTKLGQDWGFDLNYNQIWTFNVPLDMSTFGIYIQEEFHEFIPETKSITKLLLLVEEMHRLHINKFKNFPWFDYMYEGKELGIDLKEKK